MIRNTLLLIGVLAALPLHTIIAAPSTTVAAGRSAVVEEQVDKEFDLRCRLSRSGQARTRPASILLGDKTGGGGYKIAFDKAAFTLSRVSSGKTSPLATVGTREGYMAPTATPQPLVVQWRGNKLRIIYAGRTVLRRDGLAAIKGAIALQSSPDLRLTDAYYQPVEPVQFADDFMRSTKVRGLWETASGQWRLNVTGTPNLAANPFLYLGQGKPALTVAGHWFWSDYEAAVSVRPFSTGAVGLAVYYQDAKNYLLVKWCDEKATAARGKQLQLWRIWKGQRTLLASAPGGYKVDQWYRLAARATNGIVTVKIDNRNALQVATPWFGQGQVGLYCEGAQEATFDDVSVHPATEPDVTKDGITQQFTKEESMEEWATPAKEWHAAANAKETFWHRGFFFGNHRVEVKATPTDGETTAVRLVLGGDGANLDSGYRLQLKTLPDKRVTATLSRAGALRGTKTLAAPTGKPWSIVLGRTGDTISAYLGSQKLASFADAKPLPGRRAAYTVQGALVLPNDARVVGSQVLDYTFTRAPIDWQVGSGTWDIANRWMCSPGWSWYGGWSDGVAALWHKHSFSGDYVVEAYAASKMDTTTSVAYLHPREFNITVAGDGRSTANGYGCIFGGNNNTITCIKRSGAIKAETKAVLLPANYHEVAHHKWFCMRVEKVGNTLSYYIDNKLALRYTDPNPLNGRRIALWTNGNGIIIARATIYYEHDLGILPM